MDPVNPNNGRPTFLIVDDNDDNRVTLAMRLDILGYDNVIMAANGRDALERLRANRIDIIFLDIMMPELDGYGVLSEIRADTELREIPAIMISAVEDMSSVVRCIELGAVDYLTKPFNPVILKARVESCIQRTRYKAQEEMYLRALESEKRRSDQLLTSLLPRAIVRALKTEKTLAPRNYDDVAVLFCDVVGFTAYSEMNSPDIVFARLEELIMEFEDIAQRHGLEKIKTIGDAFMATAGLLTPHDDSVLAAVSCGLDMVAAARAGSTWSVRVGIDYGPVAAGIMGKSQFQFDVWGDTVNTAARIETYGHPNTVGISGRAWPHVRMRVSGRSLGLVDLKGKQKVEIIECTGLRT